MMTTNSTELDINITWDQAEQAAKAGDHDKLLILLKRLDVLGVWRVTARIGELYELGGIDLAKDIDEAVKWYRKAVFNCDDPLAHLGLGRIYFEGSATVQKDCSKARPHLEKAFANDLPQAGIYLGMMSMFGMNCERDLAEAESFFSAAARAGFPLAYRYLANIAAASGHFLRTLEMLCKETLLTVKLKIQDRSHPNLWKIPE